MALSGRMVQSAVGKEGLSSEHPSTGVKVHQFKELVFLVDVLPALPSIHFSPWKPQFVNTLFPAQKLMGVCR